MTSYVQLPRLLTTEQLADYLGLTPKAIYHMRERGQLPRDSYFWLGPRPGKNKAGKAVAGKRLRFNAESINKWIAEQRAPSETTDGD